MIHYNENLDTKISRIIKHRCKIKDIYYYIQIYTNTLTPNKKITFLIKASKNKIHSHLYKRMFYYSELLRYNKYFNYFSSLDDIFITINQCIEENKFFITNSVKCISFTMQLYISKKKKYYNINVNLNKHKNLKPLSLATKKDIQKVNLGIKSEKELNYAINEIRQRLNKLEKSQRNNNNFSDVNVLNSDNINSANDTSMNNPNSMVGLNNMMNKLNYLETSINNKDVKIKSLENRIINLSSKPSRNQNNLILRNKNYNNKSIDNNNINNNNNRRNSHFYPNQTSHDYDKSNVISTISKSNERNLNFNISQENEYESKYRPTYAQHRSKYNNTNKYKNNSYINDNSDLSDFSKIDKHKRKDKDKKIYHSIDNYNNHYNKSKRKKKSYSEIGNSYVKSSDRLKESGHKHKHKHEHKNNHNHNHIHHSSHKSSFKEKPITIAKQFKQPKNKSPKVKDKGVKKNRSVEKLRSNYNNNNYYYNNDDNNNSFLRNDYKISSERNINGFNEDRLESETNNHFSYLNNNNINDDINLNTSITKKNSGINKIPLSTDREKVVVKEKKFRSQEKINTNIDTNNNDITNSPKIINIDTNNITNKENNIINNNDNTITTDIKRSNNKNSKKIKDTSPSNNNSAFLSTHNSKTIKNYKIAYHPREQIRKYVNSRIFFRKDELRLLKDKISNNNRKLHVFFDILYRASQDGDKELPIRESIADYGETLTLFYTYEGARFGVYLNREEAHSFMKGRHYREIPGSCFIVGLNNLVIYQIDKNKTSNDDFKDVLCFGRTFYLNKNGTHWMIFTPQNHFLDKKCIIGTGEGLFKNVDIKKLVGGYEYHLKEVEIFSVAIERFYKNE